MRRFPKLLIAPVILIVLLDLAFTLIGQPKQYWQDFSKLNEGSPLGVVTLSQNPRFFVAFILIYISLIYILLRKLPLFLSVFLAISFYLGHVYGSSTWVYIVFKKISKSAYHYEFISWYITVGYIVMVSFATSLFVRQSLKDRDT